MIRVPPPPPIILSPSFLFPFSSSLGFISIHILYFLFISLFQFTPLIVFLISSLFSHLHFLYSVYLIFYLIPFHFFISIHVLYFLSPFLFIFSFTLPYFMYFTFYLLPYFHFLFSLIFSLVTFFLFPSHLIFTFS